MTSVIRHRHRRRITRVTEKQGARSTTGARAQASPDTGRQPHPAPPVPRQLFH